MKILEIVWFKIFYIIISEIVWTEIILDFTFQLMTGMLQTTNVYFWMLTLLNHRRKKKIRKTWTCVKNYKKKSNLWRTVYSNCKKKTQNLKTSSGPKEDIQREKHSLRNISSVKFRNVGKNILLMWLLGAIWERNTT